MSAYPLPKEHRQDFSTPNKKPLSAVEINHSSAFSKELKILDVFQGINYDLAGKSLNLSAQQLTWKAGPRNVGQYVDLNGSSDFIDYGFTPAGIADFTLMQVINSQGTDNSQSISSRAGSTAQGLEILIGSASQPLDWAGRMQGTTTTSNASTITITDSSLWHVLVWSRLNATTVSIIAIDELGREHSNTLNIGNVGTINSTQALLVGKRGTTFNGSQVALAGFSTVGHDLAAIRILAQNLYSELLEPKITPLYLVPSAAPAAGRIMSSLVGGGGLAGLGGIAGPGGGLAG